MADPIGIYLCHCGGNISGVVRVHELRERLKGLDGVALVRDYPFMCSDPGQELIRRDLRGGGVRRVLVAACSPALHERTFMKVLEGEGINPYLYEHVDIREGCSWVHPDSEEATSKAYELIRARLERLRKLRPFYPMEHKVVPRVLVIGGGLAGITAALDVLEAGFGVVLVERSRELGGWAARLGRGFLAPLEGFIRQKGEALMGHPRLSLYLESEVASLEGFPGDFRATIRTPRGEEVEEVGSVILAVGFRPFDARKKPEYGYGRFEGVITTVELEEMLREGRVPEAQRVAFVHCVGSRDHQVGNPYCSRVCCTVVAKQALELKRQRPEARIYALYMDVRTFGKGYEELYEEAQRAGVIYIRGNPGEVYPGAGGLRLRYEDTLLGRARELEVDLVVLAVGMEPPEGNEALARILRVPLDGDGFFLEAHPKLAPLETPVEGVYLAGCCQGPKDIPDTVSQAHGAALRATQFFHRGRVVKDPLVAEVDPEICTGCRICEAVCEFGALHFDPRRRVMTVEEFSCKGCGACAVACPSGAMSLRRYESQGFLPWMEALVVGGP
ncbi:MAG: hypothetical protein DRG33_02890 [Deltaproteobacteria bacterium]|nr:MAG: hypothetical protein DRG33_02890 [Deltaproteobacteria bacterium]HEX16643.1 CoB--CoM heterodisulfide reductase iron-sulfur subunit A family protein [Deltaproteobacteria bacterium]